MKYSVILTIMGSLCYICAGITSGKWFNGIAIGLVGIANILFMLK